MMIPAFLLYFQFSKHFYMCQPLFLSAVDRASIMVSISEVGKLRPEKDNLSKATQLSSRFQIRASDSKLDVLYSQCGITIGEGSLRGQRIVSLIPSLKTSLLHLFPTLCEPDFPIMAFRNLALAPTGVVFKCLLWSLVTIQ